MASTNDIRPRPLLGGLFLHTDRDVLAAACMRGDYKIVETHYPGVLKAMADGRAAIEQLGGRAGHLIFINGCVQVLPTRQYANVVGVVNFSRDLMAEGAEIEGRLEDERLPAPELRLQHAASSETGLSVGYAEDPGALFEELFVQKLVEQPQAFLKTLQTFARDTDASQQPRAGHVVDLTRKHVTPWAMANRVNCELALFWLGGMDPAKNGGVASSPDLTWILGDAFQPQQLL